MNSKRLPQFLLIAAISFAGNFAAQSAEPDKARKTQAKSVAKSQPAKAAEKPTDKDIHLVFEFIEVKHEEFSDWLLVNSLKSDATNLREEVQGWVKKKDALVFETVVVHARSGQRAKVESIEEIIYPTEYDPPEIGNETEANDGAEIPVTPPTAAAFETRNTGVTIEVDPVISADGEYIDLNMAPEIVKLLRIEEWETESNGEIAIYRTPIFYTAKTTTQITIKNGGYGLIGTVRLPEPVKEQRDNPIVLMFVRAEAG